MAPTNRELGPSVDKNDQRSVFGATCEIEVRVLRRLGGIFGDREYHCIICFRRLMFGSRSDQLTQESQQLRIRPWWPAPSSCYHWHSIQASSSRSPRSWNAVASLRHRRHRIESRFFHRSCIHPLEGFIHDANVPAHMLERCWLLPEIGEQFIDSRLV